MAGTLISSFWNGDATTNSLTAIQQTLIRLYRTHDAMAFGNFAAGNTSALNVLAGSAVVVNMNYFYFGAAEDIAVLNADGSTTALPSAASGNYYLVANINADKTCTIYARLVSSVTVADNPVFGGIYVVNTQQRVLGGFTWTGSSHTNKWRYKEKDVFGQYYRQYADGLVYLPRINTTSETVIHDGSTTDHTTDEVTIGTVTLNSQATVCVAVFGRTYFISSYNTSAGTPKAAANIIIRDDDLYEVGRFSVTFGASQRSYWVAVPGCTQGRTYTVKMEFSTSRESVSNGMGSSGTNVYGARITDIAVRVKDKIGTI